MALKYNSLLPDLSHVKFKICIIVRTAQFIAMTCRIPGLSIWTIVGMPVLSSRSTLIGILPVATPLQKSIKHVMNGTHVSCSVTTCSLAIEMRMREDDPIVI